MFHLMNVSQSATLKDINFIIDTLLYENVTKLLIVITRADMVDKKQLNEVILYTKKSIKTELELQNKNNKLDYILNHIQFISISAKEALQCKLNRKINNNILEKSGILKLEDYINTTIYGTNSSKSQMIIKSCKSKLINLIDKKIQYLNYELILLAQTKDELKEKLDIFNKNKKINEENFRVLKDEISFYKNQSKEYNNNLQEFLKNELEDLQNNLILKIYSDVQYSYKKTKNKPKELRIISIINTTIKDAIVDILRDYKYKFIKKSQDICELLEQKYSNLNLKISNNSNKDASLFFRDEFKSSFLIFNNEILISKVLKELKLCKKNNLLDFNKRLKIIIKDEFITTSTSITSKSKILSKELIDKFFNKLGSVLIEFEQKNKNDEQILNKYIKDFDNKNINKNTTSLKIHQKIKDLQSVNIGLNL